MTLTISDKELAAIRYGYGALKMRKHPDALAAAYTIKKMLRRKPAPSEAMCEVHLEKDGRLRVTAWVRPDQMYATLSALQSTASDPAPDLRERIAKVLYAQDSDAGPVFYAQEYADGVDAVLDVVTAHMAVNESDIVATNHVFGCERRENALRVALEAFVARKLKAETP